MDLSAKRRKHSENFGEEVAQSVHVRSGLKTTGQGLPFKLFRSVEDYYQRFAILTKVKTLKQIAEERGSIC